MRPTALLILFLELLFTIGLHAQTLVPAFKPQFFKGGSGLKVVPLKDQKILVAGNFEFVNSDLSGAIARLEQNGAVDNTFWFPYRLTGSNFHLEVAQNGECFVSGNFLGFQNETLPLIFKLKTTGFVDPDFDASHLPFSVISSIELLDDHQLLVAGFNFQKRKQEILRLNADGTVDSTFQIFTINTGIIQTIQHQKGKGYLIGGTFSTNNSTQGELIRLDTSGHIDSSFNLNFKTFKFRGVSHLVLMPDGRLLSTEVGHDVVTISDENGARIGTFALGFQPNGAKILDASRALFWQGNQIREVSINERQGRMIPIELDGTTRDILPVNSSQVLIVGTFRYVNGNYRAGITLANRNTGQEDQGFISQLFAPGSIRDLLVQPTGQVIVVGDFDRINGTVVHHLARLDAQGRVDPEFKTGWTHPNRPLYGIELMPDEQIAVAGSYDTGQFDQDSQINGIALLDKNGQLLDRDFFDYPYFENPFAGDSLSERSANIFLLEKDAAGKLYAGDDQAISSSFGSGQTLVRFSGNGDIDLNINRDFVTALFRYYGMLFDRDGSFFLYGSRISYQNSDTLSMIKAGPDGNLEHDFSSPLDIIPTIRTALLRENGNIIIGGNYLNNNLGDNYAYVVGLNPDGKEDLDFKIGAAILNQGNNFARIDYLAQLPDGQIFAGGIFDTYRGKPTKNNAFVSPDGSYFSQLPSNFSGTYSQFISIGSGEYLVGGNFITQDSGPVSLAKISMNTTTSTEFQNIEEQWSIFPNPATDNEVQILSRDGKHQLAEYSLIHTSGQLMGTGNSQSINIRGLPAGTYIVRLITQNGQQISLPLVIVH